jgi:hypothetical protein
MFRCTLHTFWMRARLIVDFKSSRVGRLRDWRKVIDESQTQDVGCVEDDGGGVIEVAEDLGAGNGGQLIVLSGAIWAWVTTSSLWRCGPGHGIAHEVQTIAVRPAGRYRWPAQWRCESPASSSKRFIFCR